MALNGHELVGENDRHIFLVWVVGSVRIFSERGYFPYIHVIHTVHSSIGTVRPSFIGGYVCNIYIFSQEASKWNVLWHGVADDRDTLSKGSDIVTAR